MRYPDSIFEAAILANDAHQTGTTEIGRLRKTFNLQQHNGSQSILSLHFAVHDSTFTTGTAALVTKMIAVSRALCLATIVPRPSDQSRRVIS